MSQPAKLSLCLRRRLESLEPRKAAYYDGTAARRRQILDEVVAARNALLDEALSSGLAKGESQEADRALQEITAYAARCDWILFDTVALAAAGASIARKIASDLAPRLLVYHSFRMMDDVIDQHHDYKGGLATALGALSADPVLSPAASGCNQLTALLLFGHGLRSFSGDEARLAWSTIGGALLELFPASETTEQRYQTIVEGKMVSYGLILYGPLIVDHPTAVRAQLRTFLATSFRLAQILNDLGDQEDDRLHRRPNYWAIDTAEAREDMFEAELGDLERQALDLAAPVAGYALSRVADLCRYGLHMLERVGRSQS